VIYTLICSNTPYLLTHKITFVYKEFAPLRFLTFCDYFLLYILHLHNVMVLEQYDLFLTSQSSLEFSVALGLVTTAINQHFSVSG
jgi:hypothetical protein